MLPALPTGMASASGERAQSFTHLEGGGLLAFDAVRVHGVYKGDFVHLPGGPLGELQGGVEVAFDLDDLRPVGQDLDGLA